ncbi:MAG: hypothetical protein HYU57_03440 [Micavibrio aeruginosavorus]|nr:hypothetical protein [Micavibrio aeruginosavorus]
MSFTKALLASVLAAVSVSITSATPSDEEDPILEVPGTTLSGCTSDYHRVTMPVLLRMTERNLDKFNAASFNATTYIAGLNSAMNAAVAGFTAKEFIAPESPAPKAIHNLIVAYNNAIADMHNIEISYLPDLEKTAEITFDADESCLIAADEAGNDQSAGEDRVILPEPIPPAPMPIIRSIEHPPFLSI